jgi:DNA primase
MVLHTEVSMAKWVDFKTIKTTITLDQILDHFHLLMEAERKGDELILRCPLPDHDDRKASFRVSLAKGAFNCFGCKRHGNGLALFKLLDGSETIFAAGMRMHEVFGIPHPPRPTEHREETGAAVPTEEQDDGAQVSASRDGVNPPLSFAFKQLDATHPYLAARGLTAETIATFGVGYYAGKGSMRERIVIPIHDKHGEHLLAYAGRWPGEPPEDTPKYLLPANFHKSLVLFNLHRAKAHATDGLIVVEGFFDCMTLWQKGRKNVVAIMGSSLSAAQERLIVETVGRKGRCLLAFDPDEASRTGMADAALRLAPQVFVRTMEL